MKASKNLKNYKISKKGVKVLTAVENNSSQKNKKAVEVLYQKMGDRWFAFSMIDDELFFGSIPENEIIQRESDSEKSTREKNAKVYKISGNS